ncbi:MAG: hypothetical protein O3B01_27005 [Planctomycetota bacterium]|nr:hypothetical protein [Planctomycetota bacterium]MDA1142228.1 hypothetical protein [Planctomycetota bacterium]
MNKKILFRIIAAVSGVLVLAVLAEVFLRLTSPEQITPTQGESVILSEHLDLRYEFRPDAKSEYKGIPWQSNSVGFRDHEYTLEKGDGVYRIMIFGDSVMHGGDMVLEKIAAKRLERMLNEQNTKDGARGIQKYEVINCAVPGYDFGQAVAALKHKGLPFKPDLAIFGYCLNDPDVVDGELGSIGDHPELSGLKPTGLARHFHLAQLWFQYSRRYKTALKARNRIEESLQSVRDPYAGLEEIDKALLDAMRQHIEEHRFPASMGKEHNKDYFASLHINKSRWLRVEDGLERLQKLKTESDFKVMVALLPLCVEFKPYYLEPVHKFLEEKISKYGFEVIDLYRALKDDDPLKLALSDGDRVHYSEFGHRRLAEELAGVVLNIFRRR